MELSVYISELDRELIRANGVVCLQYSTGQRTDKGLRGCLSTIENWTEN